MGLINNYKAENATEFASKTDLAASKATFFITDIRSATSKLTGNKQWFMDIVLDDSTQQVLSQDSAPFRDPIIYILATELEINPDESHPKSGKTYGPVRLVKKGRMFELEDVEEETDLNSATLL